MADCGAAGTALDRAIRAATGHQSSSGSKQAVVNLLGHGVVRAANQHQHSMPMAPPTSLRMGDVEVAQPQQPVTAAAHSTMEASSMDDVWAAGRQQHPRSGVYQQQQHGATPQMMHPAAVAHHHHMMHQQQQHMMMQHQMQQMNLYMSQQQQQAAAARSSTAQQQQAKEQTSSQKESPNIENWHEGLEDDALNEAGVQGATIEELAAAWQAAEADYYEDAVNLASAVNNQESDDATLMYPYDFSDLSEAPPSQNQAAYDWMKEGLRWFEQGEISKAIRCFETEVRHVHPDNAKAWHMLGKCHAENDEDRKAIACLERSVERDPYNPQALLALGVSYVNELHPARALSSLKAWITHNPRYAGLELEDDDMYGDSNKEEKESEFDQVQRLLLRALEYGDDEDGDIQEALGVVYNVSRDYGAAVQAFRKALQARGENDYSLWNKLGATLANSNQSEEALPAYHRAL
jgi:peroxin-5